MDAPVYSNDSEQNSGVILCCYRHSIFKIVVIFVKGKSIYLHYTIADSYLFFCG